MAPLKCLASQLLHGEHIDIGPNRTETQVRRRSCGMHRSMPACRHLHSRIAFRAYPSGDRDIRRSVHQDGSLPVYRQLTNNPPSVFPLTSSHARMADTVSWMRGTSRFLSPLPMIRRRPLSRSNASQVGRCSLGLPQADVQHQGQGHGVARTGRPRIPRHRR